VRVLLVSPNRLRHPYPVHPIGLDLVAGALAPAHDVRILDLCPLEDAELPAAIADAVRAHAPGLVGVSLRNVDDQDAASRRGFVADAAEVVRAIRAATAAPVVLGGAGFTLFPEAILAAVGADLGVVGEGERARGLVDALAAGRSPAGLPGVVVRGERTGMIVRGERTGMIVRGERTGMIVRGERTGMIVRGERAARPPPPASRPVRRSPAANPALPFYLAHGGILGLQTQRGCAFRCAYCTYPLLEGGAPRGFDPGAVAAEALALEAAGARFLFLTDSVFNGAPDHALAVAAAFGRADLRTPWGAYFAPTAPPPGFYPAMRAAGCTHVEFGTDALSEPVLRRLHKPFRVADALAAHAAARAAGLHVAHFLALGAPGERPETLDETLAACERLEGAVVFLFCGLRIYPGTALAEAALAEGQLAPGEDLLAPRYYEPPGLPLPALAERVARRAEGRPAWILGHGRDRLSRAVERLHARGHTGPLWELLL
jgi:radical SAM superfamily enzyme YgiQ (UPF0313 family)